jgi:hypothetical protein
MRLPLASEAVLIVAGCKDVARKQITVEHNILAIKAVETNRTSRVGAVTLYTVL